MKISELIALLKAMKQEHGDLDVERADSTLTRVPVRAPRLDHKAILKGREHKPRFASSCYSPSSDEEDRRGEKVCRL